MGYVSHTVASKKPCCSGCSGGAPKCGGAKAGMGATVMPVPAPVAPVGDPNTLLRSQVNRFLSPLTPAALQLGTTPVAPTGPLDLQTATYAAVIYQRRATDAYAADPTQGAMVDRANSALADPLGFVSANIDEVTQTVMTYGDLNGVPPASISGTILGIPTTYVLAAGALALLAFFTMGRR